MVWPSQALVLLWLIWICSLHMGSSSQRDSLHYHGGLNSHKLNMQPTVALLLGEHCLCVITARFSKEISSQLGSRRSRLIFKATQHFGCWVPEHLAMRIMVIYRLWDLQAFFIIPYFACHEDIFLQVERGKTFFSVAGNQGAACIFSSVLMR